MAYNPIQFVPFAASLTPTRIETDPIRPTSLYVESTNDVDAGHLVKWTGSAAMFSKAGDRIDAFSDSSGHEYALSSVVEETESRSASVAGIVMETAAEPDAASFLHKGVHSHHTIKNAQHILRVATRGSVVLAWVLDEHENQLEGVYTKLINATPSGKVVVRELGDHFTISETTSSVESLVAEVDQLTARLNELTNQQS